MNAQDYIKAWTAMDKEFKDEFVGIRLTIPTVEQTNAWIKESEFYIKND
tara:strand:+ start:365 stop:511 length:147 start_codon:yes stop_codon:yes gene_type:complete